VVSARSPDLTSGKDGMEVRIGPPLKMVQHRPVERTMLFAIVIGVMLVGFAGLMGYMMYLTPGPSDRL
jgi:hypothetical protein